VVFVDLLFQYRVSATGYARARWMFQSGITEDPLRLQQVPLGWTQLKLAAIANFLDRQAHKSALQMGI
jgi:hypothetical protein